MSYPSKISSTSSVLPSEPATPTLSQLMNVQNSQQQHAIREALFRNMGVEEAIQLGRTSSAMHAHVQASAPNIAAVTGVRRVDNCTFWSTQPVTEENRYFKPLPALGEASREIPHISEQRGYPCHLTDVATVQINSNPYIATVQFHETPIPPLLTPALPNSTRYGLGPVHVPDKKSSSCIYELVPPEANMPTGTHVNPRYVNAAAEGRLNASARRLVASPQQTGRKASELTWGGKVLTGRDRVL